MVKTKLLCTLLLIILQVSCERSDSANPPPAGAPRSTTSAPATPAATATKQALSAPQTAAAPSATITASRDQAMEDKLMGTWIAKDVDSKIGEVKIKLTFRKEGRMKLAAWSDIPLVGQVRDKAAPYEVHGDVISSEAIRGGTSVTYWFDGEQLVIRYEDGKTIAFNRP